MGWRSSLAHAIFKRPTDHSFGRVRPMKPAYIAALLFSVLLVLAGILLSIEMADMKNPESSEQYISKDPNGCKTINFQS